MVVVSLYSAGIAATGTIAATGAIAATGVIAATSTTLHTATAGFSHVCQAISPAL